MKAEIITTLQKLVQEEISKEIISKGKSLLDAYQSEIAQELINQKKQFIDAGDRLAIINSCAMSKTLSLMSYGLNFLKTRKHLRKKHSN